MTNPSITMTLPMSLKDAIQKSIHNGVEWLLTQQAKDGGWHSKTYGGLHDGAGITSLVLYTLAQLPERDSPKIEAAIEKSATFLATGFEQRKTIASPDGSLDYPTYASALILAASRELKSLREAISPEKLIEYLLAAQVNEKRGFDGTSPDYGGWDLLGAGDAKGITTGTNVSVMCFVLEALRYEANGKSVVVQPAALAWLKRAQASTGDGGFPFTAQANSLGNKAEWKDALHAQPRSYGSATCDGLRCLLACGVAKDDASVQAALKWISDHPTVEFVPGFEDAPPELGWKEGLRYYYAQSLANVLQYLPEEIAQPRAEQLARFLLAAKKTDHSWRNRSARMREDDPLIATCFALIALSKIA